ncbi:MAG TPA: response regulator [Xanthobacteraceae bacterium]|jgi:two-component system response regulator FixJ|nr:response regulator [Xanthobacteraceae bacterium]
MTEPPGSRTPKPVVAVVDDDPAVCNSLKFSLELEGLSVRAFYNGAEFAAAENLQDYACFVIDQILPDTSGMQLIEGLRRRHIAAPAILIVGRPHARLAAQAAAADVPIIEKPLVGNALLATIREACKIAN